MNKLVTLVLIATFTIITLSVTAQETKDINFNSQNNNIIIRNNYDMCWNTTFNNSGTCKKFTTPVVTTPVVTTPVVTTPVVTTPVVTTPVVIEKNIYTTDTFFNFDKFFLKQANKFKLNRLIHHLQHFHNIKAIVITGYTDSIGSIIYNKKLSIQRAKAVKTYLISQNIKPDLLYIEGKGEIKPVFNNNTAIGRAKNRRVEIKVISACKK